jgi:mono/diheme cytochrome c family protein
MDCHEPDGRGDSSREMMRAIPDFTKPSWHITHSGDAELSRAIREGKGVMPAMKGELGTTDVMQLVAFVRDFRGGRQVVPDGPEDPEEASAELENEKPVARATVSALLPRSVARATGGPEDLRADAARGLYQRLCVSCHGADGRGSALRDQMPGLPDFTSLAWHQQRSDAEMMASLLDGKGRAMPSFDGRLDDAQVRSLVAHLRTFAPSRPTTRSNPDSWTDFDQHFQQLEDEMDELKRQYHALSSR